MISNSGAGVETFVEVAGIVAKGDLGVTNSSRHSFVFGTRDGLGCDTDVVIVEVVDGGTD